MQGTEKWIKSVQEYENKKGTVYEPYTNKLKSIFINVVDKYSPLITVEARTKSTGSFAEKILRKKEKYTDPLRDITDICGIRIITSTLDERDILCKYIEEFFVIDWENSLDVSQRLKPSEFGYRSIHYIVQPKIDATIGEELNQYKDIKAEIQVRTLAEHLFAEYVHDVVKVYKLPHRIPESWTREMANVAAMLENIDKSLLKTKVNIESYESSYSSSPDASFIKDEIAILKDVLDNNQNGDKSKNLEIVSRIIKHAKSIHAWDTIIDILENYKDYIKFDKPYLLRDLGISYIKKYQDTTNSKEYKIGQKYLKDAMDLFPVKNIETILAYADSLEKVHSDKAGEYYFSAYKKDITNPLSVIKYILYEIKSKKTSDLTFLRYLFYPIDVAIERCLEQIGLKLNLPESYYNLAALYLFKCILHNDQNNVEREGHYYRLAFSTYAKAIYKSAEASTIKEQSEVVEILLKLDNRNSKLIFIEQFLALGQRLKEKSIRELNFLSKDENETLIVVGSCDDTKKHWLDKNKQTLIRSFSNFSGTIISGGTKSGICGFVGELKENYQNSIKTIGYVPIGKTNLSDQRYDYTKNTNYEDFSEFEAIHYWEFLIEEDVNPQKIKVLGIDGGNISFFEYQMALAFGINVAICGEVNGEQLKWLFSDKGWLEVQDPTIDVSGYLALNNMNIELPLPKGMLIKLPSDEMTIKEFIEVGFYPEMKNVELTLKELAESFHRYYTASDFARKQIKNSSLSLQEWDNLRDDLKFSNLALAKHTLKKLDLLNCTVVKAEDYSQEYNFEFTEDEIEKLAQMEHGRWNVERLLQGWRYGTKNIENKTHNVILPWSELTSEQKKYDLQMGDAIITVLEDANLKIFRN